jgi:hypothetical protein
MHRHPCYGRGLLALVGLALAGSLSARCQSLAQAVRACFASAAFAPGGAAAPRASATAVARSRGAVLHAPLAWHGHLPVWAVLAAAGLWPCRGLGRLARRARRSPV